MKHDNDNESLRSLINRIIIYRFTRNIDKILDSHNISHAQISEATGRRDNWFNRSFNELEDMHISTFIKILAGIQRASVAYTENVYCSILTTIFDEELIELTQLSIDLAHNDLGTLLQREPKLLKVFTGFEVYIKGIMQLRNPIPTAELKTYRRLMANIDLYRERNEIYE